jgi:hypothetical protein
MDMIMKVIKSKFGSCVQEGGKPVECTIDATFLGKFEHDGRWYVRVRPMNNDKLEEIYIIADIQMNPEIVIKMPYRYKKFSFYVSKDGVPSSVYEMELGNHVTIEVSMTNISATEPLINWKCNNINIKTL